MFLRTKSKACNQHQEQKEKHKKRKGDGMKLKEGDVEALRNWAKNEEEILLKEDVIQVLKDAERPLTQDEIIGRVEELRAIRGPV